MTLRNYELDQKVTLREVYEKLRQVMETQEDGVFEYPPGSFTNVCRSCDYTLNVNEIVLELLYG